MRLMSVAAGSLSFGAVIKGAVVGAIASLIESSVVGWIFMSGTPKSVAEGEAATKALMASQSYLLTDLGGSLLCMAIGGYVAASSAKQSGLKHGIVTGVLLLAFVAMMMMMISSGVPRWYTVTVFILIIPAAALGGMLRG